MADDEDVKVIDLLLATDVRAHRGLLYDIDGDGVIDESEELLRTLADDVLAAINDQGDK